MMPVGSRYNNNQMNKGLVFIITTKPHDQVDILKKTRLHNKKLNTVINENI